MPNDTITKWVEVSGTGNTIVVPHNGTSTILGVAMQQANVSSDTDLRCGNEIIARNYATNFSYVPLNKTCTSTINIDKTGNDKASLVINYVPYELQKTSTSTIEEVLGGATTTVQVNGGYDGANLQEWLFVVMVVIFIISWLLWPRISFTNVNK